MHAQHDQRNDPGKQREWRHGIGNAAIHDHAHAAVEVKGDSAQNQAEGDAEDHRRQGAANNQRPVPEIAPARILNLGAVFKARRPEKQCEQSGKHGRIEHRERRGIGQRHGREDRARAENQPDLIAVPCRGDNIDQHLAFVIRATDDAQHRADPQIKAAGDAEPGQQNAQKRPPENPQNIVIHCHFLLN